MSWLKFTKDFFTERRQLLMVFVLVDSSIPPVLNDLMALEWLHGTPPPSLAPSLTPSPTRSLAPANPTRRMASSTRRGREGGAG